MQSPARREPNEVTSAAGSWFSISKSRHDLMLSELGDRWPYPAPSKAVRMMSRCGVHSAGLEAKRACSAEMAAVATGPASVSRSSTAARMSSTEGMASSSAPAEPPLPASRRRSARAAKAAALCAGAPGALASLQRRAGAHCIKSAAPAASVGGGVALTRGADGDAAVDFGVPLGAAGEEPFAPPLVGEEGLPPEAAVLEVPLATADGPMLAAATAAKVAASGWSVLTAF